MNYNWENYIDSEGDFNIALYVYKTIYFLMKSSLDLGTLLSSDPVRLRAYKEQIKSLFKGKWMEMAQALEAFDIIVPCGCPQDEYCTICGGARYRLNTALSPDELREISVIMTPDDPKLAAKLEEGLKKAMEETKSLPHLSE